MLSDPSWINILRILQPDVFCEVARRIFAPSNYLIHWAENNPVCCAYGVLKEIDGYFVEGGGKSRSVSPIRREEEIKKVKVKEEIVIEWDVFLDPGGEDICLGV